MKNRVILISTFILFITSIGIAQANAPSYLRDNLLSNFQFWFASLAAIISTISIILSLKSNKRSKRVEMRAVMEDKAKGEAALCLFLCETAAGKSCEISDKSHPEWKDLSTSLYLGEAEDNNYSIQYVQANYQTHPQRISDKIQAIMWEKWYIGIKKLERPLHIYALFGELPKLLKRPDNISFEIANSIPGWIQKLFNDKELIVGITFCDRITF